MNVLIIGGTRFMGPHPVRRLQADGHQVTVFHRGETANDVPDGAAEILGDRARLTDFANELHAVNPEVVVDMMLATESEARQVVDVFGDAVRRIVPASSCDVYQNFGLLIGSETGPGSKAAYWSSRQYIPTYAAWGRAQGWYEGGLTGSVQPSDGPRFLGPLVVLTGPYTFSAAEDFVVPLDYADRAVFVGDTTGGSTGQPLMMLLPGGGSFRVCTKRDRYPDGREFCGFGIAPDIVVLPTVEAVREDRDPVMEAAVAAIADWEKYGRK